MMVRIITLVMMCLWLSACGGGSSGSSSNNSNSNNANATNNKIQLPSVSSSPHTQMFNLGHSTSAAFANVQGFQVSYGGLTQTLQKSTTGNSWTVVWDGTYDGVTFNNWVAFGYDDTPNHAQQSGRFYQNYYNQTQVQSELVYFHHEQIAIYTYLEDGTLHSTALYVPRTNLGPRVIMKDHANTTAGVIDLADPSGSAGVMYDGCTADLQTLKTDVSSCTTSVAF